MSSLNFCFKIGVPQKKQIKNWGDYYLAKSFGEELERQGHRYFIQILPEWDSNMDYEADVVVHFRGLSKYNVKPHHFNIMWNISHPESIEVAEYNSYDLILVASSTYANKLRDKVSVPVYSLLQFVDLNYFYPDKIQGVVSELLFVGNSRGVMRKIVKDIIPPPMRLEVYGGQWDSLIPKKYLKNKWYSNEKLRVLYSSCLILLNDHWDDMRKYGFINNRVFDALACKTILINDDHQELKKLFPECITYSDRNDLLNIINDINNRRDYYIKKSEILFLKVVKEHSVAIRVNQFLSIISNYTLKKYKPIIHEKKAFKKSIKGFILDKFGYGKVYRAVHKSYVIFKKIKQSVYKTWSKIPKKDVALIQKNLTSESEIRKIAKHLAKPVKVESGHLVSIIIPNRNGLKGLRILFPHLINNTLYKNYEVIIVDNGSNDGSIQYINSLQIKGVKLIKKNGNMNFSEMVNTGVEFSSGNLITVLRNNTIPLYGWLDELLKIYYSKKNCGVVGSRIIYSQLDTPIKNLNYLGCSIHHDGIKFQWTKNGIKPLYIRKYENPLQNVEIDSVEELPVVSENCILVEKQIFKLVGGFNEDLINGYEGLDFCLKVIELNKHNYINRHSMLLCTQESKRNSSIDQHQYQKLFNDKWRKLNTNIWKEKLFTKIGLFSNANLHVSFLVTENNINSTAGDLFSAQGLGESLQSLYQYQITYLPNKPTYEWSKIPPDSDLIISMLHDCDIRTLNISDKSLKIAWIRGHLSKWLKNPWIGEYDGIIASSEYALQEVRKVVGDKKCWGVIPLGVTSEFIGYQDEELKRDIDVCFVGNIFEVERDIVKNLDLNQGFNFNFFGKLESGRNHPWKAFHRGIINHSNLPMLYRRTKIVIEDIAPFNFGTVNLRVFEAAASGSLVIANEAPEIKDIFGDNVITYKNKDDLTRKINYYLNNEGERRKKAEKGRDIVLKNHTFLNRAKQFHDLINRVILEEDRLSNLY